MSTKRGINLKHYSSIAIVLCLCIVVTAGVIVASFRWVRLTLRGETDRILATIDEQAIESEKRIIEAVQTAPTGRIIQREKRIIEAIPIAMSRQADQRKREIIERMAAAAGKVASSEIERLNKAEEEYGKQVRFEPIPWHPKFWGSYSKIKHTYYSHEIVDARDSASLVYPYEVTVRYHYRVLQTDRMHSKEEYAQLKAERFNDFHETGRTGTVEVLYALDDDLDWNGEKGELLVITGDPGPLPGLDEPDRKTRFLPRKPPSPFAQTSFQGLPGGSTGAFPVSR